MSFGKDVAESIARTATLSLIARAEYIVDQCTTPGCRTSTGTQNQVIDGLHTLSNYLAQETLKGLQLPAGSPNARVIVDRYDTLGYTIAVTYTSICINTGSASTCTFNSEAVNINETSLAAALVNPVAAESKEIIIVSMFAILSIIALSLSLIFFVIAGFRALFFRSAPTSTNSA